MGRILIFGIGFSLAFAVTGSLLISPVPCLLSPVSFAPPLVY
jgi:uncharacterized membrane protein